MVIKRGFILVVVMQRGSIVLWETVETVAIPQNALNNTAARFVIKVNYNKLIFVLQEHLGKRC